MGVRTLGLALLVGSLFIVAGCSRQQARADAEQAPQSATTQGTETGNGQEDLFIAKDSGVRGDLILFNGVKDPSVSTLVMEINLNSGKAESLITSNNWLNEIEPCRARISVPQRGDVMAILNDSDKFYIRDNKTGRYMRVLQDMKMIELSPVLLTWSDSGRHLAVTETPDQRIWFVDTVTGKGGYIDGVDSSSLVEWVNDDAIIVVESKESSSVVSRYSLDGKRTKLLSWHKRIQSMSVSSSISECVFYDGEAAYKMSCSGGVPQRVDVPVPKDSVEDWESVGFFYNQDGSALAVLCCVLSGEPHMYYRYNLYVLSPGKKPLKIHSWDGNSAHPSLELGEITSLHWTDNRSLLAFFQPGYGEDIVECRGWAAWAFDATQKNEGKRIFGSSSGNLQVMWRQGS